MNEAKTNKTLLLQILMKMDTKSSRKETINSVKDNNVQIDLRERHE